MPAFADLSTHHDDLEAALHRRDLLLGGAALAGLVALGAGCSDGSSADRPGDTTRPDAAGPSVAGQRVVALDPFLVLPTLVRLGIDVVGTFANGSFPAWLPDDAIDDVTDLGGYATPNLEALLALAPDAIVGLDGALDALPADVADIATVHTIPFTGANAGWRDGVRRLADLAGAPGALDDAIASLDDRAAAVAADREGSPIRSAALVRVRPDEVRLHGANHFGGSLLVDCGLALPALAPSIDDRDRNFVALGPEELEVLDSDVLFVAVGGGGQDEGAADAMASVEGNPLWGRLPAVAAGRVVQVGEHWTTGELTAAGLVVDDVSRALDGG